MHEEKTGWPKVIASRMVGEEKIVFRGIAYPYAILDRELNPDLPGFLGCLPYGDKQFFFLSEDVPKEFREFQLVHEIMEFTEFGRDVPGSCLKALMHELALVPEYMLKNYLPYRRDFFRSLVRYREMFPESWSTFDDNIKESLFYLEEATRTR